MSRPIPLSASLAAATAFQLIALGGAAAAELRQPVTLSAPGLSLANSPGAAQPPGSTGACSNLPDPTGTVHDERLVVRNSVRPDVGPYSVRLPGYGTDPNSAASDSYAPFLINLSAGDTLRLDLVNQLTSGDEMGGVVNLHTHGLIVNPHPCTPLSDYIFVEDQPGTTTSYRVDIPATLPGLQFSSSPTPQPYPSGLSWFHAHLHGKTQDDLTAGQSGFLYIGDLEKELLANTPGSNPGAQALQNSDTLYLGLRDIQLAVPFGAEPDKVAPGQTAQWISGSDYNPNACLSYANPPITIPGGFSGPGYCGHHVVFAGGKTQLLQDTVWLFTVNGQQYPTITMKPGRNQVWRIANLSPDASYVLELDDDATGQPQQFDALALDGLAAGTNPTNASTMNVGVPLTRALLMPASRAEILLLNQGGASGRTLTLRTTGITTGAQGSHFPRIDLAHVVMPPATAASTPVTTTVASMAMPMAMAAPPPVAASTVASTAAPTNCITLPPGIATRRQIIFTEDGNGNYMIGSQVVTAAGIPIPGTQILPQAFPMAAMLNPNSVPHVCAKLGTTEVWEVINASGELHNFHIHQNKFRLTRQGDPGAPANVNPFQDPSNLVAQYEPEATGASPIDNVDVWHDVLPLPPYGGRIFVTIPFMAPQQVGDFVYHCHILTHEDHGMMAPIQVYDPGTVTAAKQTKIRQAKLSRRPSDPASDKVADGRMTRATMASFMDAMSD